MTLYLRERRKCKDCEYFYNTSKYSLGKCHYNPPAISGEHQSGRFPEVYEESYCSKWEPRWHDNPVLREAWREFLLVRKLIISGEDEGEQ